MKIEVKLYASLGAYLPAEAVSNVCSVEISSETKVEDIISTLGVPKEMCHLVLLNGIYIAPDQWGTEEVKADDVLAIWPPIAGG